MENSEMPGGFLEGVTVFACDVLDSDEEKS